MRWLGRFSLWLSIPASVCVWEASASASESAALNVGKLNTLHAAMQEWVESKTLPNVAVLVLHQGEKVFEQHLGTLDLELGAPVQPDSLYRIYSMTKPVTAIAALMLVEQGELALDDPIVGVLPEFANLQALVEGVRVTAEPMTLRHLLSHSAGLSYGYYGDTEVDRLYREVGLINDWDYLVPTTHDLVVELGKLPLLFQPGERFHYSFASDVVGEVVSRVSRKTLDVFFKERLWNPLGISDAYFDVPATELHRFGTNQYPFHDGVFPIQDTPRRNPEFRDVTFLSGGGGLVMSLEDFGKFAQFLLDAYFPQGHMLLRSSTLHEMFENQLPSESGSFQYGLGFGIRERPDPFDPFQITRNYYWGGAAGTSFWVDPKYGLAVVFFTQLIGAPNEPSALVTERVYEALEQH